MQIKKTEKYYLIKIIEIRFENIINKLFTKFFLLKFVSEYINTTTNITQIFFKFPFGKTLIFNKNSNLSFNIVLIIYKIKKMI